MTRATRVPMVAQGAKGASDPYFLFYAQVRENIRGIGSTATFATPATFSTLEDGRDRTPEGDAS